MPTLDNEDLLSQAVGESLSFELTQIDGKLKEIWDMELRSNMQQSQ